VNVVGRSRDIVVHMRNGGVIPPERVRTLFEPFHAKSAAPAHSTGLGLGLFISHEIATAHGGDITVESSVAAGGTIVTVRLPRTENASAEGFNHPASDVPPPAPHRSSG